MKLSFILHIKKNIFKYILICSYDGLYAVFVLILYVQCNELLKAISININHNNNKVIATQHANELGKLRAVKCSNSFQIKSKNLLMLCNVEI